MRKLGLIIFAFMLLTNTLNVRTNARILTSNVLDSASNVIHPYRTY